MAYEPSISPVVIPAGLFFSGPVRMNGADLLGVIIPANWINSQLTFRVSVNGVNYYDLHDIDGVEILIAPIAGKVMKVPSGLIAGWGFVQFRSGIAATPVVQTFAQTLHIITGCHI
jgi:hypothetical protein